MPKCPNIGALPNGVELTVTVLVSPTMPASSLVCLVRLWYLVKTVKSYSTNLSQYR